MSACGASRHFAATQQFGRFRSEAGIEQPSSDSFSRSLNLAVHDLPRIREGFGRVVPSGKALPPQAPPTDWGIVRTGIQKVWPEAEAHIEADGYHLYKMQVTFDEIG
jgi:hypothetical protein